MVSVSEAKRRLRKQLLERRNALSENERTEFSLTITNAVLHDERIKRAQYVHCYLSFASEVKTRQLIEVLWEQGKTVFAPIVIGSELLHSVITSETEFVPDSYGIPTPVHTDYIQTKELLLAKNDCVIVPVVGFDAKGARLGYGKGFYDRFLTTTDAFRCGVAFSCQLCDEIPTDEFDMVMDMIITERQKIKIKE